MGKATTFFLFLLLIFSASSTHSIRPPPEGKPSSVEVVDGEKVEGGCDGVGEEECLMRRTLAAHTDYIYTQEKPLD